MSVDDTSSDPRLDYTGQTESQVNADYAGMPGGAQIVMTDDTSGATLEGGTVLFSGGSGKVSVAIDASIPAGAYRLTAQDAAGEELTQTVQFYISHD
ncbi:MAG: hypothetical protein QOF71_3692 [Candidatus Eremiobacteraeota bacterium]|jgi:hypothetical protein|nr:hypothetical protein [Candidatus Eremiobacteraeota bacterium]